MFEILVNKTTSVTQSPRKFDILPPSPPKTVTINEMETLQDGTKVTLKAKIISVAPVRAVSTGKVQDVSITDASGSTNLSAWEENVDKLEVGMFSDVYVCSYRGEKSITLSRQSTYKIIEDESIENAAMKSWMNFKMLKLLVANIHVSCLNCSGKLSIITLLHIVQNAIFSS